MPSDAIQKKNVFVLNMFFLQKKIGLNKNQKVFFFNLFKRDYKLTIA